MTKFGDQLRKFRHRCNDSKSTQGKLTQEKFGERIGVELGISYTGAAVSDWERGQTKIHADDRALLMALIKVLHAHEGIRTIDEANQLLKAGNFRNLDTGEAGRIFAGGSRDTGSKQIDPEQKASKPLIVSLLGNHFSIPEDELQKLIARAEEGPSPSWPRKVAVLMRKASDRISLSPKTVLWLAGWWIAWWLTAPSLRWPFANRAGALQAIGMYIAGTLIVPFLIGMLIDTKHNEYWEAQGLARSTVLRLYTYQGAGIGFNLGYFFVLPLVLIRHYLNLEPSIWLEIIAVTLGLILGNMSARVVPYNLWLAYGRLRFTDGAIFFVVAFLGPLWGLFFLEYYPVLLRPVWGSLIILAALLLFMIFTVQQSKKKMDSSQAQP